MVHFSFRICRVDRARLDSFDEFCAHLKKPEVRNNIRRLLMRFSSVSRSLSLGAGSSLGFLFTNETNVTTFIGGLLFHYYPEKTLDHTRKLALQAANVKRVTANLIGAVNRLVVQLNGPRGWSGVSRDEIIGFNDVLGEYYPVFHAWMKLDQDVLRPNMENCMNDLIKAILPLMARIENGEDRRAQLNEFMEHLNRLRNTYTAIFGSEAFEDFTRRARYL